MGASVVLQRLSVGIQITDGSFEIGARVDPIP